VARCPAHDDRTPSLKIDRGRTGNVLLFCHAGCDVRDVLSAVGLTLADIGDGRPPNHGDGRPPNQWRLSGKNLTEPSVQAKTTANGRRPHPGPAAAKQQLGKVVAVYRYRDEHGAELFQKLRYEPKTFRVRRPNGSWGIGDARRVLYRLPEVLAAAKSGKAVLLVEGEKDADRAARELGIAATCNFDGAAKDQQRPKWLPDYTEALRGAQVLIIADNDDPGFAHARAAADALAGVADRVGVFRAAVDTPGADLSDHLDAGYGLRELVRVEPNPPPPADEKKRQLPTLSQRFWSARPMLTHIRTAAHARGRCADLVLHATLARLSGMLSHELRFETGLGTGSLNYFVAAVGPSGVGKSTGADAAAELVPTPCHLQPAPDGTVRFRDGLPIGSGEGLAEAYMGTVARPIPDQYKRNGDPKTEKVRAQIRHNAFVYVDEGEALTRMSERSGATIGPTLRSAWTGALLGQANAREETTRILPARSYSLGVLIGFQRHTCRPLLADMTAGTPQRFVWCSAIDTTVPAQPPDHPGALHVSLTDVTGEPRTGTIVFPESIRTRLWERNHSKVTGQVEPAELDSHEALVLCKAAALLAVLDGRMKVDEYDWDLAEQIWESSCAVRDSLVEHARSERARAEWIKDARQIELKVRAAAEVGQVNSKLERIGRVLAAHVAEDGALSNGAARQRLAGRDRSLYDSAVEWAVADGQLRRVEGGIATPLEATAA
jgi:hypothetical protein